MTAARTRSGSPVHDNWRVDAPYSEDSLPAPHDDGLSVFMRARPRLFGIAYRILRCAAAAEDIVQDVWVRWQTTDRAVVRDAVAFLATIATRLSLNVVQSARARREISEASWLPEPVDASAQPGAEVEHREALEAGVRLLLETLPPTERAVYILREAFGYAHRDIAAILRLHEANARQLLARARRHLASGRPTPARRTGQCGLCAAFMAAAETGDVATLEALFTSQAGSSAPGLDSARASRRPRPAGSIDGAPALCHCAA